MGRSATAGHRPVEWITLGMIAGGYLAWGAVTHWAGAMGPWLAVPLAALTITLHSSLQHEVLHGHPLPSQAWSAALVLPAPGLFVPYQRFRDLHLAHHNDAILTDPYDDPESNFLDPAVWARLPRWWQRLRTFNNTLLGRMLMGPGLSIWALCRGDLALIRRGDRAVLRAWLLHLLGLVPVVAWLALAGTMTWWAYILAAYLGFSVLKIRTFLEHRANERAAARSVIIEDRGPLALLFLNNNYHAVHHARPRMAWYQLPRHYRAARERYLKRNGCYRFRSYGEVFAAYFLRAKDPVPHPLWQPRDGA